MKKLVLRCLCLCMTLTVALSAGAYALAGDEFEEVAAVDNEECAITIKSVDIASDLTLKAALENKSGEKTYMFAVESASINGVENDPFFATEVAPGKKANKDMKFRMSKLKDNGVGEATDVKIVFRVYDSNDWSADPVAYETVHVYPLGEDKAELFMRQEQDTDVVLADNESAAVIVTGCGQDGSGAFTVQLFLDNRSDKDLMFSVDDASVNGYMIDPFYAHELMAETCCFGEMKWSVSKLEENDIGTVEEVEFALRIYDSNDWLADDIFNGTVLLTP